jgi:hypothetical protein
MEHNAFIFNDQGDLEQCKTYQTGEDMKVRLLRTGKTGRPIRREVGVWFHTIVVALKTALIRCSVKECGLDLQPYGCKNSEKSMTRIGSRGDKCMRMYKRSGP